MAEFRPIDPADRLLYELMPILIGVGRYGELRCYGSCFIAWGHMAITAKHVIEDLFRTDPNILRGKPSEYEYWVVQVKWHQNGHEYVVWTIDSIGTSPHSDIAIVWLRALNDTAAKYQRDQEWKAPVITFDPPPIGAEVKAFGLHTVRFEGSRVGDDGKLQHLQLNFERSISAGLVKRHYWEGRDRGLYSFPCFEVDARFEHGMSGGLVINDDSQVCGIVCGSLPAAEAHQEHISYVTMLWPMMAIPIDARLVPGGVQSTQHRLRDLAARGIFTPKGWERVLIEDKSNAATTIRYATTVTRPTAS
jgi:hypothetical protein